MKVNYDAYCSYDKRFQEVANLYIKDDEVIKHRGSYEDEMPIGDILKSIQAEDKVIVEANGKLICFFKDEEKRLVTEITNDLVKQGHKEIQLLVWYGVGKEIKEEFLKQK